MALIINGTGQDSFNINGIDIDNLYVDTGDGNGNVLVFSSVQILVPPIYLMTEDIVSGTNEYFLYNSASSGETFNGRLEHVGDGNGAEGSPWYPITNLETIYPQTGTIDLVVSGDGTRQINTQWTPPSDSEWTISGIYNVDLDISYEAYTIHYNGIDSVDIYLWSNSTPVPVDPTYENIPYDPPAIPWLIKETPPDIITVNDIIYTMDLFTDTTQIELTDGLNILTDGLANLTEI